MRSSVADLLISFLMSSVPLGSFSPHISGPLTVNSFVEILFILYRCMQITKVGHAEGNCYESKCHHRFVLTKKKTTKNQKKQTKKTVCIFSQNILHSSQTLHSSILAYKVKSKLLQYLKNSSLPSFRLS